MIEQICSLPPTLMLGGASLLGAMGYAGVSILAKRNAYKEFKVDYMMLVDTMWQSTLAGVGTGIAIGCSWSGLLIAMVTGVGVDKICNKLSVSKVQFLNLVKLVADFINKEDK